MSLYLKGVRFRTLEPLVGENFLCWICAAFQSTSISLNSLDIEALVISNLPIHPLGANAN